MADTSLSELDKALVHVEEHPDDIHIFYNAFLNSVLYLPTHDVPEEGQEGKDKQLRPIFAQSGETLFLLLFDSLERLTAWAKKDMGYVGLEGHAILEMMDPQFHWYLNYGSEHGRAFGSEEIAWLKSAVQKAAQATGYAEPEEVVEVGEASDIPNGLVEELRKVAESYTEIKEVALGQFLMIEKMDQPDLALAIRADALDPEVREQVLIDFTTAARGILDESEEFWVFIVGETQWADRLLGSVNAFYLA